MLRGRAPANPIAFPFGRAPGINPGHPASAKLYFSAIANGGNFVNLLTGIPGTVNNGTGAPTANIDALIGPSVSFASSLGLTGNIIVPGAVVNPRVATLAAIATIGVSVGTNLPFFCSSAANGAAGWDLRLGGAGNNLTVHWPGVGAYNSPALATWTTRTPYFFSASVDTINGIANYAAVNLFTGQIYTGALTGQGAVTPIAPSGGYMIGNYPNGGAPASEWEGAISAVMFSGAFLSLPQHRAWATDLWDFWISRGPSLLVGSATAATAKFRRTLSPLGARIGSRQAA